MSKIILKYYEALIEADNQDFASLSFPEEFRKHGTPAPTDSLCFDFSINDEPGWDSLCLTYVGTECRRETPIFTVPVKQALETLIDLYTDVEKGSHEDDILHVRAHFSALRELLNEAEERLTEIESKSKI